MKKWIFAGLFLIVITVSFADGKKPKKSAGFKWPILLTVDFKPDVPLKYKFVCERQIALNLDPSGRYIRGGKNTDKGRTQNMAEKLEMEIVYKPLEVDPYGYSIIEANCLSVKVTRSLAGGRSWSTPDAVESLASRSFTLKITPAGKIADYSSLEALIKELGQKAFGGGGDTKRGKIKDPDMIMDFVATQWHIWDSVSSVKKPLKGLKKDYKWNSKLLAPMPFVSKIGRDVKYKLSGVIESNDISYAEITSDYSLSKSPPDIPMPYSGSFQMRGTFGFLQGYKVLSLEGTGRQLYDIKKGLIKSDTQRYKTRVSASIFGLGGDELNPNIEIDQTITMTLVE
jgi:hypothetical protein